MKNYELEQKDLINQIYKIKHSLPIIKTILKKLEEKFNIMKVGDVSRGDEYWYIILKKVIDYLSIDYKKQENITNDQLAGILIYIQWFNSQFPLRINKKGNYILPIVYQPPEIIL